jgi:hypothetical protein
VGWARELPKNSPRPFWDRLAFTVGGVDFLWIDVVLAAMVRGEWSVFERRLAEGVACASYADCSETDSPSEDALEEATTAFRYDRELIEAADVEAWLERVALSAEEWTEYIRRDVLRRQWSDELDDLLDQSAPSARELLDVVASEGICSGAFDAFEATLAGRAALVFAVDSEQFHRACDRAEVQTDASLTRLARTHEHWLALRPPEDALSRLSVVVRLDAAFTSLTTRVASENRMSEILEMNRLEWIRLDFDTLSFASEPAAREAILCVRVDGLSLYDVGSLSRRAVTRTSAMLQDIEPERRDVLLSAEPGVALGPLLVDGRFDVTSLIKRTPPSLEDPDVAARARDLAVELAVRRAARDHVTRRAVPAVPSET